MRFLILSFMLICSCSKQESAPTPQIEPGVFSANDRDGLCIAGQGAQRGGFVVYGTGDHNCSVSGPISQANGKWELRPAGDSDCRIELQPGSGTITLGRKTSACDYYCGPGANFTDTSFKRIKHFSTSPKDIAGDPLC